MLLLDIRYCDSVWCSGVCGTGLAHVAISLRACYWVCGTELAYGGLLQDEKAAVDWYLPPTPLPTSYKMSGTNLAVGYFAYACSLTPYPSTRSLCDVRSWYSQCTPYGMSDTAIGSACARRWAVLRQGMALRAR
eukprot:2243224-Rhodomonas_salina.2